jgi:integrase
MGRRQFGTVRRLPSGRWQARYWEPAAGERVTAPRTFASKSEALRWLASVETDRSRGPSSVGVDASELTFAEWANEWLLLKPAKRATSLARDRAAIRVHFNPVFGDRLLHEITPLNIRAVVGTMRSNGLAAKSIRTYMGTLAAIFNSAVELDLLARSPVRGLGLESVAKRGREDLTVEQLYALASAVPERFRALVLTAGILGLRWSEAIALRLGDVDLEHGVLSVRQTVQEVGGAVTIVEATKSEAGRRSMTVPPTLVGELDKHVRTFRADAEPDALVFTGPRGGVLRRHFLPRVLKPAAEKVGLPVGRREGLDFHGLRHAATSLMVATGEHPRVMQARLGHATPHLTLGLYAHVPDDADRAAAARLETLLRKNDGDRLGTQRARNESERPSARRKRRS